MQIGSITLVQDCITYIRLMHHFILFFANIKPVDERAISCHNML